jgi:histidinol phosphatase-like enzyme (inositol monophosphatase family)
MNELVNRLDLAIRLVREAGEHVLGYYQNPGLVFESKPDHSPVTRADKEGEEIIRSVLETECPADTIVGEEYPTKEGISDYTWYIDPIDGTESFIRGVPLFGTMVAVERSGKPVIGAVYFPAIREIVYAAKGSGTYWATGVGRLPDALETQSAHVSAVSDVADATLAMTGVNDLVRVAGTSNFTELLNSVKRARGWSDCYGHYLVATGRVDIMIDPYMSVWDNAPLLPIIEEAGGRFSGILGEDTIHAPSGISTNGFLHDAVLRTLNR